MSGKIIPDWYIEKENAQRVADKLNEEDDGADYSYVLWMKLKEAE